MRRSLIGAGLLALSFRLAAATFTVTNTGDSGAGSLRQAITDANTAAGLDTIAFNVSGAGCDGGGVCTITPASQLPTIGSPGPHRRLHAARLSAEYQRPGRAQHGAQDRAVGSDRTVRPDSSSPRRRRLDDPRAGHERRLELRDRVLLRRQRTASVRGCFIGTDAAGTAVPELAQHPRDRRRVRRQLHGRRAGAGGPQPDLGQRPVRHHLFHGATRSSRATSSGPTSRAPPCSAAPPSRASAFSRRHPAR